MTANEALNWGLAQALDHVLRPPSLCNGSCRAEDCAKCEREQYAAQRFHDAASRYKEPWPDFEPFEPDDGDGYDRPGTCSYERNPSDKYSSVAR